MVLNHDIGYKIMMYEIELYIKLKKLCLSKNDFDLQTFKIFFERNNKKKMKRKSITPPQADGVWNRTLQIQSRQAAGNMTQSDLMDFGGCNGED